MKRHTSLRLRLLAGAAIAVFAALAIAWVIMILLFSRHVERRVEAELLHDATQLVAELQLSEQQVPVVEDPPGDPRFDLPVSGLYWQVSNDNGVERSRSLWDQRLPAPAHARADSWSTRITAGPFGEPVFLLERRIRPEPGGEPVLVQLAHDMRGLRAARSEFGRELALFLTLLWLVLIAAAWLQVRLGLRPLDRVRQELAKLHADPAARLGSTHPVEITPLTSAINKLAEARAKDLARARRRAADLAHSLKTPLAALSAQSRQARDAGAKQAADGLDKAIAAVTRAVETEISRARVARMRSTRHPARCAPHEVAERIVGVVERTDSGRNIVFEVEIDERLRLNVAADDLTEILGALTENAARYARRRVRISSGNAGSGTSLGVEDDGPGLGDLDVEIAFMRGGRLDELGPDHDGLGLAIVRDLVEATDGQIDLKRSPLGGLHVLMFWP